MEGYMECVTKEAAYHAKTGEVRDLLFETIFIGGGTPSIVPVDKLSWLIGYCRDLFKWSKSEPEITVEANPDSIHPAKLEHLIHAGVNRLSIGVQDLTQMGIRTLGRIHSAEQAQQAVLTAKKAGFSSINIDIIYGFPGQDTNGLRTTLERAVNLNPDHVSCYELTLADGTLMQQQVEAGTLSMPDDLLISELTDIVEDYLSRHGYRQYEISNFAKPGFECRHNLDCWNGRQYLGLGCSAVSWISGKRRGNSTSLRSYMEKTSKEESAAAWTEQPDSQRSFKEMIITGLRKMEGVSPEYIYKRCGIDMRHYYKQEIEELTAWKMLEYADGHIRLSKRGRRVANQVLCRFV